MASSPKQVIFVGGAPFSGKTTFARILARDLGYDLISVDDLTEFCRGLTDRSTHPWLHRNAGSHWEYYLDNTVDRLLEHAAEIRECIWPALKKLARARFSWGHPAVIEGWLLEPSKVRELSEQTDALWLIASDDVLEARVRDDREFYREATDPETMISRYVGRSVEVSKQLRAAAPKSQLLSTDELTAEELVRSYLNRLSE